VCASFEHKQVLYHNLAMLVHADPLPPENMYGKKQGGARWIKVSTLAFCRTCRSVVEGLHEQAWPGCDKE
jgi:hypothetical protein